MRVVPLVLFLSLAVPGMGFAQQNELIHIEKDFAAEPPTLTITNNYQFPITAFVVVVNPDGRRSPKRDEVRTYHDIHVNRGRDLAIARGAHHSVHLVLSPGVDSAEVDPEVHAVLFADGSTLGDERWIQHLLQRRRHLYRGLVTVHKVITEVVSEQRELIDAIAYLQDLRRAPRQPPPGASEFRAARDLSISQVHAYAMAISNLQFILGSDEPGTNRKHKLENLAATVSGWMAEIEAAKPQLPASAE